MESNTTSDIVQALMEPLIRFLSPDVVLTLFVINVVQLMRQDFHQNNKL